MSHVTTSTDSPAGGLLPAELVALRQRVQAQPAEVRSELEPMVEDALEEAWFRGRVVELARDALVQLRLDLEITRFDLEATRRERERLRERLAEQIEE